mmetsp:Transcript_4383/g.12968  ORF Transcript_4383/g.12968 Transcript_4383/m.12968 type:complete len:204 (+) Transcript_4383:400-1011(+)
MARASSVATASSAGESREWKRSARSSFTRSTSGGAVGTPTTRSVTSSVPVGLSNKTTSWKAPTLSAIGPSTLYGSCSAHSGRSEASAPPSAAPPPPCLPGAISSGSRFVPRGKPCRSSGKSSGNEYCADATQSCASGRASANAPAKYLCSNATVGRRIWRTAPAVASTSASRRRHSSVGATAEYSSSPPASSLTAVIRTGTCT